MTSIPSHLARVPTMLSRQLMERSIVGAQSRLLEAQMQLASGKAINRPSDNPIGASAVSVLDDLLERRDQRLRNLSHADSVLATVDQALNDAGELLLEAKGIGSSQIGITSDAATRENQAKVIDSILNELSNIANRQYQDLHLFGGTATGARPFVDRLGGIAYRGMGEGLSTDLGLNMSLPITMAGEVPFGSLSKRVEGDRDLNPGMSFDTRLSDLNGAQGLGIRLATVNVDINGSDYELDLTGAINVGDIASRLTDLLNTQAPGALGAGGITVDAATGDRFNIDLNPGFTVTISDLTGDATAADLGLSQAAFADGVNEVGADVNPRLTELTPISALTGVTVPLGTVRISNGVSSQDVDLSGVTNIRELMNEINGLEMGLRVEISPSRDRFNIINQLSGSHVSLAEVGGGSTATELGIRSLTGTTLLADFNDGRGVSILSGNIDPVTGLPDPARDRDFRVMLKDGRSFDVDLAGATTVQDVLDIVNADASAAGILPADFAAGLAADGNGIEFTDNTAGGSFSITALNGSFAAEHLGILGSTSGATFTGEDRAKVAVDSVFSHLIALRDALRSDDTRGITLATEKLDGDINRLARARAEAGVRARLVTRQTSREEDLKVQDTALKSELQDLDFTEAAIRFSSLQQQLQAGLATAAQAQSLTLLDFLR